LQHAALPARLRADVRALLPLPRLSAANRQRLVLNALIETNRVTVLSGAPNPVAVPTDSGRPHRIFRCPDCQTAVWSEYGGLSQLRFVRVGTLDEPASLPPDIHIYTRSKLPWVSLPAGIPAVDAYYDSRQLWPAASLERRRAILG
jgi:hypothetical protein